MEKVNWPMVGIQAISTIVIVVISLLTFTSQAIQTLREEMRAELSEMRVEFSALRSEVHDMNGRLGRVEGLLGLRAKGDE